VESLSLAQKSLITKARTLGSGAGKLKLDDAVCAYLVSVIVEDLGLKDRFSEFKTAAIPFYTDQDLEKLTIPGVRFLDVMTRLVNISRDADTYFACLASLHTRRLKLQRIMRKQAFPSMDQVGPRGLLQFGSLSPKGLATLLFWRKWIFDIDNRVAQETGYVFEPILAFAIGGMPVAQGKSPIRRESDKTKGRQVDCVLGTEFAYEMKLRVTIAASGQGRWAEELQFPIDCQKSGYKPILVVFDPTKNVKLDELEKAFRAAGGEAHIGPDAWSHLDAKAGPTMATFIEKYVRKPIADLIAAAPEKLPDITFSDQGRALKITVGEEVLVVPRDEVLQDFGDEDAIPEDAAEQLPGID